MKEVIIIDYNMGNLRSIQKKCESLGYNSIVTGELKKIESAHKMVLPGVGHFSKAVENLKNTGVWDILHFKVMVERTPIIGICLGMQLMASWSEEGNSKGFGWIKGNVVRFNVSDKIRFKIPHIGWNTVSERKSNPYFEDIKPFSQFYFVHSYHFICSDIQDVLSTTMYEDCFVSSVSKDNILGVQFHPEKSHNQGELLLKNFLKI